MAGPLHTQIIGVLCIIIIFLWIISVHGQKLLSIIESLFKGSYALKSLKLFCTPSLHTPHLHLLVASVSISSNLGWTEVPALCCLALNG